MHPQTGDKSRELALSIDVGTSSARVMLWDTDGHEVEPVRSQRTYRMDTTPDGGVEMDINSLASHVELCIDEALQQAGQLTQNIKLVGISTFWHSCLGIDDNGGPITPLISWADRRAGSVIHELKKSLDPKRLHERTGCPLHPSYYPARLAWLKQSSPSIYKKAARWVSPGEYFFARWFGEKCRNISVSMASATGLFNQKSRRWDAETISALGISEEKLAPIAEENDRVQGLTPSFSARWPALKEVPFFFPIGDGACSSIGSGGTDPDTIVINLGTSGAMRVVWDERKNEEPGETPEGLWRYRVDANRAIAGAAFSDGGIVYEWMLRTLQLPPADQLERELSSLAPGSGGESFLPYLAGERSPGWNPERKAEIAGLTLSSSPLSILQASMEGVALQFAWANHALKTLFPANHRISASGGGLGHSPVWAQMFADVLGCPIQMTEESEASSRGAALLAMESAGIITVMPAPRAGSLLMPRNEHHYVYKELLSSQLQLYHSKMETD